MSAGAIWRTGTLFSCCDRILIQFIFSLGILKGIVQDEAARDAARNIGIKQPARGVRGILPPNRNSSLRTEIASSASRPEEDDATKHADTTRRLEARAVSTRLDNHAVLGVWARGIN